MKKFILPCLAAAFATAFVHAAPVDDVKAAAKKLTDAANYAWTNTTEVPDGGFGAGVATGVTEKGGFAVLTREFNGNKFQTVRKGETVAFPNREGTWVTREEMIQQMGGGGGGGGRGARMFGVDLPAEQVVTLAEAAKELKLVDGALVSDLSEKGATELLTMGRNPPKNATGSVKIWLKDGALSRYQVHIKGTVTGRNGEERNVERTTTTEIKDVGTTKVQVPEEAQKKFTK